MLDPEQAERPGVAAGSKADAIVGHHALNLDAETAKEAQGVEQETQAGGALLIRQDFPSRRARMVIDRQMHVLWERQRNSSGASINWMFTPEKARAKMARVYPTPTNES